MALVGGLSQDLGADEIAWATFRGTRGMTVNRRGEEKASKSQCDSDARRSRDLELPDTSLEGLRVADGR